MKTAIIVLNTTSQQNILLTGVNCSSSFSKVTPQPQFMQIGTFKRPVEPIVMYEFDACPFCKKVREMCSFLDLDVLYRPCPSGGVTFRPEAVKLGGKSSFPYMVDPNTGTAMYESDDIIAYLAKEYGNGEVPLMLRLGVVTALTAGVGAIPRYEILNV